MTTERKSERLTNAFSGTSGGGYSGGSGGGGNGNDRSGGSSSGGVPPRKVNYSAPGSVMGTRVTARQTRSGVHETTYNPSANVRLSRDVDHSGRLSGVHIVDQDAPKHARDKSPAPGGAGNAFTSLFNFWSNEPRKPK